MSNITFLLFAYNEEKRIGFAIKNLIKYGQVFVLDGGSIDSTKQISEKMGAKVFNRPPNSKPYAESEDYFSFIKGIVNTDWIYWGYVDNIVPKKALEKFLELSSQSAIKYVYIQVYTYLCGDVKNVVTKTDSALFFMKDYLDFSQSKIHSMGKFTGKESEILHLPNNIEYAIRHYSSYTTNKFVNSHLRYAEIEAMQNYEGGKKFSLFYLIGHPIKYFFMYYKGTFKSGVYGLIMSLLYAVFRIMVYARVYELEHNITPDSIEKAYSDDKETFLKEF